VTLIDPGRRRIELRFDFPSGFPRVPPKVNSNLPIALPFEWDPQESHLSEIVDQHREVIPSFAPFWEQLEEIDRATFVIEPREPSLNCCFRRIVVTNQVEIQIEVDPRRPFMLPKVTFIGATVASRQMREHFESRIGNWQAGISLKVNLENALGMRFPEREAAALAETDFDCGICYLERLGGEIPEIVCGNVRCAKRFHRSCLVDWLRTGTSEQSFQVVFGACPFCSEPIQCTL
jgi:E3 ubiquitin-protein ligase FANCL